MLPYGAGGVSVKACLWRAPLQTVKPQEEHEARKAMTEGSRTWLSRTDHEQLDWGPNLPSDMEGVADARSFAPPEGEGKVHAKDGQTVSLAVPRLGQVHKDACRRH